MKRTSLAAEAATAAAIAASCAIISGVGLATISKPKDLNVRLDALEAKADRITEILRPRREPLLPPGVVCDGDVVAQADRLKSSIAAFGSQQSLQISNVLVAPEEEGRSGLIPVKIRFQATGSYEGTLGALEMLSSLQPRVFVDTVDLTSNTSSVTLAFVGRAFCDA